MITCFDIGGSTIKSARARSAGEIEIIDRVATPLDDFDAFAAVIAARANAGDRPSKGVSISIAGVVDPASGSLKCANIPCVDGRLIAADLERFIGLPVWIANDADCFALAEATSGAGKGHRNVFGVILGTGVGGGLVIDGRIVAGAGGYAGEWGHGKALQTTVGQPPVEVPHFACGCGQSGCVDTIGGARGMEKLHKLLCSEALSSTEVIDRWRVGEVKASRTIGIYLELVSVPLALTLNIIGSSIVPVGGGLSNVPELIEALDREVRGRTLRRAANPLVVKAALTTEPGLIGAAALGLQEITNV
ncbi:ROK family protein [Pseudaminobacter soli (ex Li et al. 2025)]|uniref:N-acetylglucosamine kinase n=1 Tax=Pseudaminobacter soli (ex Li et al. 2025) TaxID=1295366 RepID=A0A2P7SKH1_9HYPH|nr:ROK family protein [Mesorhizobium soli]PSJ62831.1 N-acetylglucosamine kinase [Mesorhizobium soli]